MKAPKIPKFSAPTEFRSEDDKTPEQYLHETLWRVAEFAIDKLDASLEYFENRAATAYGIAKWADSISSDLAEDEAFLLLALVYTANGAIQQFADTEDAFLDRARTAYKAAQTSPAPPESEDLPFDLASSGLGWEKAMWAMAKAAVKTKVSRQDFKCLACNGYVAATELPIWPKISPADALLVGLIATAALAIFQAKITKKDFVDQALEDYDDEADT